ncbi:hypothetical protein [Microbacterium sp. ZXX196]|uniref:hypothetical protein n=1 Tax=Microbacterium sp. ZXX196 TaxID=2609291 RepID=UPI0012B94E05|nr:hypothetical protein [Microbacterium sp. ZXX196]MTE24777.1 hypothetical protein [Microbacterium sp. ZXX196]
MAPGGSVPVVETGGGDGLPAPPAPSPELIEGWNCLGPGEDVLGPACAEAAEEEPADPGAPEDPEPEAPVIPALAARDVASFAPGAGEPVIEPYGIAIADAPMNVAFAPKAHTVGGELFGLPIEVTFTPELLTVDYGDGTVVKSGPSAATWEALGQEQLTPTSTSHAYADRGTYPVRVSTSYAASVDFGPWGVHEVSGFVVSDAPAVDVTVYEKQSFLVARTCEENPAGPGCAAVG